MFFTASGPGALARGERKDGLKPTVGFILCGRMLDQVG